MPCADEILADDASCFAGLAQQAGMAVECRLYDGMWHNVQMFNQLSSTADKALDEIAGFVLSRLA